MNVQIDQQYLVDTLVDLVRINSVNPELVSGAPGEAEIAAYLAARLQALNVPTKTTEIVPGRVNVVGTLQGAGGGRSLLLNAHTDTVGVDGMAEPFGGEIRDGRVYGRGSQDMKGSIAAIVAAVRALVEKGVRLKGDLVLAFVADEEYGSIGTEHLVGQVKADAAIVAEPTDLDICLAHKGFWVFEFETKGRPAHGARHQDGIDANMHMGWVMAELHRLAQQLASGPAHPLLGRPSVHVPLIAGGTELFVYAGECRMRVERRTLPGETSDGIRLEMEEIIAKLGQVDPTFQGAVRPVLGREPFEVSASAEIVTVLGQAAAGVLGKRPGFIGHDWWEDSALIAAHGTETVIMGPRGAGIHSTEEWVDIQSVIELAEVLAQTAICYCGEADGGLPDR
jgi:acetylornithine deacetylase